MDQGVLTWTYYDDLEGKREHSATVENPYEVISLLNSFSIVGQRAAGCLCKEGVHAMSTPASNWSAINSDFVFSLVPAGAGRLCTGWARVPADEQENQRG